ncbi:globin family protein [Leptospira ellisii]|uniref:Globin family protein n=1 Tax=Leptospira ellisii TaxID=2023197 RepID=A0A2N0BLW2_9LEPT|nr:globin family protein [Leptospira ellisii]MDV6236004.1 globin family protein [Leptospira ellisii]PJZ94285.1 hemin receptor [Leptospira ellisii]PKA04987.1 hemin receptor [Leptospira ellisii]
MLKNEEIELVRTSFEKLYSQKEEVAALFYGKLFELEPSYKSLFKGDMAEQGRKLMVMLRTLVSGLDNLGSLVPVIQDMGKRHVKYGVRPSDYDVVGAALLATLQQGLGNEFTPRLKRLWTDVYQIVAKTAIEGSI